MANIFILQLTTSFVVGFVWIAALSIFAERLGTRVGGALAGVPATMAISLFFIGWTQSAAAAAQATTLVPLVLGCNLLFIAAYIALARLGLFPSLTLSLFGWFLAAMGVGIIHAGFWQACLGFLILFGFSYLLLEKIMRIEAAAGQTIQYGAREITLRGLVGGGVIVLAVWGAHVGGPLLGGVLATFPALTVALILIAHSRHGPKFTAHLLKHFALGGVVNVLVFALVFRFAAVYGLAPAIITAFAAAVVNAYGMYSLLNKRIV